MDAPSELVYCFSNSWTDADDFNIPSVRSIYQMGQRRIGKFPNACKCSDQSFSDGFPVKHAQADSSSIATGSKQSDVVVFSQPLIAWNTPPRTSGFSTVTETDKDGDGVNSPINTPALGSLPHRPPPKQVFALFKAGELPDDPWNSKDDVLVSNQPLLNPQRHRRPLWTQPMYQFPFMIPVMIPGPKILDLFFSLNLFCCDRTKDLTETGH